MIRKTNLAHRSNYGNKRSTSSIKYIVLHYTANDGDSDENNGKYFSGANRNASAHIFVDDDSCTQSVPDNYVAWSVGGSKYANTKGGSLYGKATNANTLNIEMCDTDRNGRYEATAETQKNTIAIVREKMSKYNIPIERVIRHYDVTGKLCPAYFVDEDAWEAFKAKITGSNVSIDGSSTKPSGGSGYDGNSIVDYLKSIGKDSSFAARKQYAAQYGISNYSGTAEQNAKLLSLMRGGSSGSSSGGSSGGYYPAFSSSSIVDGLKSIGVESSMGNRKKIAAANGISGYTGTAAQNEKLCSLARSGKLKKAGSPSSSGASGSGYYKAFSATSIVDGLKSIGIDSGFANRKKIAAANGISNYTGTAAQNTKLCGLAKQGKLKKA